MNGQAGMPVLQKCLFYFGRGEFAGGDCVLEAGAAVAAVAEGFVL